MSTTTHIETLTTLNCCSCCLPIGLSKTWVQQARDLGHFKQMFTCPYCKTAQGWGTSQAEKKEEELKRQADMARNDANYYAKNLKETRAKLKLMRASRDGMKGALVKTKKRVSAGVCPCCNRSFASLARHMKSKHPNYTEP